LPKPGPVDQSAGDKIAKELSTYACAWFEEEGIPENRANIAVRALLRFHGQGGEIAVDWGDTPAATQERFRQAHEALYGFVLDAQIELVTLRIEAVGRTEASPRPSLKEGEPPRPVATQMVHWEAGDVETPIYDRASFCAHVTIAGPAVITQLDTTTIIPPGWTATVHSSAALLLKRTDT